MAQLAAQAKGLYYPTPKSIVEVLYQTCAHPVYSGVPLIETGSVEPNYGFQIVFLNPPYAWDKEIHRKNGTYRIRAIASH